MVEVRDVVLLPSLGRPARDFDDLGRRLTEAGLRPLAVDPRPRWDGEPTLHDLAADVVARAEAAGLVRFHLVGHAFGNRLARCVTADAPGRVASLTLLAAGGLVEPAPEVWRALAGCFDLALPEAERLVHVATAFFAPGHDPAVWRDGWTPEVMRYQRAALQRTARADWWGASVDRVLVVQGLEDAVAPVENGRRYVAECAPHARLVEIDRAGHALIVEQPGAVAAAVVAFLRS